MKNWQWAIRSRAAIVLPNQFGRTSSQISLGGHMGGHFWRTGGHLGGRFGRTFLYVEMM